MSDLQVLAERLTQALDRIAVLEAAQNESDMSKIILAEQASAPDTPDSGKVAIFVDTNGDLAWKDDAGNVIKIAAAGSYTLTIPATGTAALRDVAQTFSAAQTFSNALVAPGMKPASDSTTALQLQNAAGTAVLTVDTTNSKVDLAALKIGGADLITAAAWTPVLAFSGGNGTASMTYIATYVNFGNATTRLMYLYLEAVITKGTAAGNLQFTGMPQNAVALSVFPLLTVNVDVGLGSAAFCNTSGAIGVIKSDSAAGGTVYVTAGDMAATSYIRINGIYRY